MKVDRQQLLVAIANTDGETQYFVDLHTGQVRRVTLKEPDTVARIKADATKDPKRFQRVPLRSGREKVAELHEFAQSITDARLRAQIEQAISFPNPHREIRLLLERRGREMRMWETFLKSSDQRRMMTFLKLTGLSV